MIVIKIGTVPGDVKVMDIPNTLESLQEHVGGYIETCAPVDLKQRGIELIANEEGLLKGLAPNPNLYPFFFVGTMLVVGVGDEDFTGLTDDQMLFVFEWLNRLV